METDFTEIASQKWIREESSSVIVKKQYNIK